MRVCALCNKEIPQGEVGFMIGGLVGLVGNENKQVVLNFHLNCARRFISDLVTALIPKNQQ